MPDVTPKLGIKKPLSNEYVKREAFNENWDIVDQNAASQTELDTHKADQSLHLTEEERTTWNAKETPSEAQAKTDQALLDAKNYADAAASNAEDNAKLDSVSKEAAYDQNNQIDPNTTTCPYILTNHNNAPKPSIYWYIRTYFNSDSNNNKAQIAIRYHGSSNEMHMRHYYNNWTSWTKFITEQDTAENINIVDGENNLQASNVEDALKELHDTKETPAGAQAKANAAETNAKNASVSKSGDTMTGALKIHNAYKIRDLAQEFDRTSGTPRWIKIGRIQNKNPIDSSEITNFSGMANIQCDFGAAGTDQAIVHFSFGVRHAIIPLFFVMGDGRGFEFQIYKDESDWHWLYFKTPPYSAFCTFTYNWVGGIEQWIEEDPTSVTGLTKVWDSTKDSVQNAYVGENKVLTEAGGLIDGAITLQKGDGTDVNIGRIYGGNDDNDYIEINGTGPGAEDYVKVVVNDTETLKITEDSITFKGKKILTE
ncbi:pyocin knob domain-containing protein [Longirhabdus pacifica]|uniref:pyocin knob domain-containing protein n=1 Tax=Longirhabdus pacifica TaxID=2305227 RepID=UPI001008A7B0|nr:pyocin knob domain-containing protein [Longirhabdus pacifica]